MLLSCSTPAGVKGQQVTVKPPLLFGFQDKTPLLTSWTFLFKINVLNYGVENIISHTI